MIRFLTVPKQGMRWGLFAAFAFCMIAATGCSVEQTPLAAGGEDAAMATAEQGQSYIIFNPLVAEAAGKKIKNQGKKIKDNFNHRGGELVIEEEWEGDDDDGDNRRGRRGNKEGEAKKRVGFKVKKNAIAKGEEIEIAMEIWGDYASEMVIGFTPSGYEFKEDCVLEIEIKGDWVDLTEEQIQALHISASGQVESAQILRVEVDDDELKIRIRIPGFSRYSMGGGA